MQNIILTLTIVSLFKKKTTNNWYIFQSTTVLCQLYKIQIQLHLLLLIITLMLHTLVKMGIAIQLEISLDAVKLMAH